MRVKFLFSWCNSSPVDLILPIFEYSRSHSDPPQSVRYLCTSDQPDAETSTSQHRTSIRDRIPYRRLDSNPNLLQARDRNSRIDRAATAIGKYGNNNNNNNNNKHEILYRDRTNIFFRCGTEAQSGHGLLILEVSRSHQRRIIFGRTLLD